MPLETVVTSEDAGVFTITLSRPEKRNALNPLMMDELMLALREADAIPRCGVVILTGAGKAFCAGLDLEHLISLQHKTAAEHMEDSERIARMFRALYEFPKPTIAAVNGAAIAGGTGIATICDFTLAVPEAKFGYTEARIGFVPALVSSFLVPQIGEKRARELLLTARLFDAREAHALGLVNEVVEPEELMPRARQLAQQLLKNSPESLMRTKRLLADQQRPRLDAEIKTALEANVEARATADFREGIRSFLEKRAPVWPSRSS